MPMCASKNMKLSLTIPLVILCLLVAKNIPELRRYLRISRM